MSGIFKGKANFKPSEKANLEKRNQEKETLIRFLFQKAENYSLIPNNPFNFLFLGIPLCN